MRRTIAALALIASPFAVAAPLVADSPEGLPNCVGSVVWVNYGKPVGCDVNPPQVLHERYIPSSWTLAQAHSYCTQIGAVGAFTRYSGTANVCPDVDY